MNQARGSNAFWPDKAELIIDRDTVCRALDAQSERLARRLDPGLPITVVAMMNGGMYPAVELTRRLDRPFHLTYVHATRYRGRRTGGEISWLYFPVPDQLHPQVLLIDDIYDEGHTMDAVRNRLLDSGVKSLITAVLALKRHERGLARDSVDDYALEVPDRYVFGCGMDVDGYWRQLPEIWAVPA